MVNRNACSSLTVGGGRLTSPAVSGHCSGKSTPEMEEEDGFYEKLNKINESSGLSLLFNFRDTSMDLYHFYKIVTKRGGYHEVTKGHIWEDVASRLNIENRIRLTPTQLQNLYANILYPFEQTYHYRTHTKPNKASVPPSRPLESREYLESKNVTDSNSSSGKRKQSGITYLTQYHFSDGNTTSKKIQCEHSSPAFIYENGKDKQVAWVEEKKPVLETPEKVKETRRDLRAPLGSRNCYQMYIKMECDKLKSIHGENPSAQLRDTVVEAWRHLSDDDKKPYIEASKKDKERFVREMAAYETHKRKQRNESQITNQKLINFANPILIDFTTRPSHEPSCGSHMIPRHDVGNQKVVDFAKPCYMQTDDDYYVALQPDDGDEIAQVSDESMVQMAVGLMKNARPNDPIFQIDWDEYCGASDTIPH